MYNTGSYATMVSLCSVVLGILLGSIALLLFSAPQVHSQSYCRLPIDKEKIKAVAVRNLKLELTEGDDVTELHVKKVNFTCLASRGLNRYSSATVVTELLVTTASKLIKAANATTQFQMGCVDGMWGYPTDLTTFDGLAPKQPFEIPLETQCYECTASYKAHFQKRYDSKSNCIRKSFPYLNCTLLLQYN